MENLVSNGEMPGVEAPGDRLQENLSTHNPQLTSLDRLFGAKTHDDDATVHGEAAWSRRRSLWQVGATVVRALFITGPPSLVIFTPLAVAATLFMGLVMSLAAGQIMGDLNGALRGFLLVAVSLPIALSTTITLALVLPYRAYASPSPVVALIASYSPYVLGALTGIWGALWLGKYLPFGYEPLTGMWKGLIASIGPGTWLFIGLLANHLATVVARRIEYEKGLEELQESRHRMMLAHEHTRKEVAGLLHGRVQSRLVVVRHWLKECQENLKDALPEMTESLDKAADLLRGISDQELRSITRQLYPSIIRTGLPSALNSLADRFRAMFFVELEIDGGMSELESPVAPKLNDSVRLTIYRITEEALGNVAKHSEAVDRQR